MAPFFKPPGGWVVFTDGPTQGPTITYKGAIVFVDLGAEPFAICIDLGLIAASDLSVSLIGAGDLQRNAVAACDQQFTAVAARGEQYTQPAACDAAYTLRIC